VIAVPQVICCRLPLLNSTRTARSAPEFQPPFRTSRFDYRRISGGLPAERRDAQLQAAYRAKNYGLPGFQWVARAYGAKNKTRGDAANRGLKSKMVRPKFGAERGDGASSDRWQRWWNLKVDTLVWQPDIRKLVEQELLQ
jgi:hypothetical protein